MKRFSTSLSKVLGGETPREDDDVVQRNRWQKVGGCRQIAPSIGKVNRASDFPSWHVAKASPAVD